MSLRKKALVWVRHYLLETYWGEGMKLISRILCVVLILLLSVAQAIGEIYNCNGVWTSAECEGGKVLSVEDESRKTSMPDALEQKAAVEMSQKKLLIHDLTMKSIKAKREFEIRFDASGVEAFCLQPETSLEDCQQRIEADSDRLENKTQSSATLKAQQEANQLQKEKNERAAKEEKSQVVVVQPNPVIIIDHPERRHGFHEHRSEGFGVKVEASSGSGSVSVQTGGGGARKGYHGVRK